ncbi:hypothetical protein [Flavobacterium nackdongense]|uniref:hypothetical protein n=1 Tax=Flavobacterium nackdongense TaxID=2547394 RepID=UPI0013FD00AF|nr:hypothetical protein [Flavobacterium nackdongense]
MKKPFTISILAMSAGIGTAMGVALKDTAVGFAIGIAIFVMMIIAKKTKKSKDL